MTTMKINKKEKSVSFLYVKRERKINQDSNENENFVCLQDKTFT